KNNIISSMNKPGLELLGWSANDIIGTTIDKIISPEYHEFLHEILQKVRNDQIPTNAIEIGFVAHSGQRFHADINLQTIYLDHQPSELIFFIKNILLPNRFSSPTHDKHLESIGTLAGGIAHDFNNILAALMGNVTYALEQNDLAVVKSILTETEQTIHRGQNLSYQLLTFSKGGEPVKHQEADLTTLISKTAINTLRSSTSRCTLDFDEDLWEVNIDAHQIPQALGNIIVNADEAMEQAGNIYISFHNRHFLDMHKVEHSALAHFIVPPGKYIEITIRDEGTGIADTIREKIFDPYFSTKGVGAGLGLATAYSIIRNHAGYLTFTTRLSGSKQGTTFYFYLPVHSSDLPSPLPAPALLPLIKSHGIVKDKILILEDEPAIVKILDKMLRHLKLYPTFTLNGSDTIEEYKKALEEDQGFNLVLIDLTIPGGLGGKETIQVLQKLDPNVKAIVSSGYSNNPIMSRPTEYGFQDVLKKPFTLGELREIITKYT
ncbi:MAG: hybrid sensor histidine kinase/response regulator, partial [Promethearchaeota archaeon]